ncbi:MAG: translation initiation factor IF-3 [Parcubacteria group bacterium Gr01-1014_70]|nr:MAG: translation initiation factor IF-3 [Parcubacteria group bacterium Gr01-1014_70]
MIGKDGENLGVVRIEEALKIAAETELDLIEVSPKAQPPVARIADYGKYQYQKEKEARESGKKQKTVLLKAVRVGFNASPHDMELRAKKADELLEEAGRVQIDFILKGRAKYLDRNFIQNRLSTFLSLITVTFRKTGDPKKGPRGLTMVLEREK